MRIENSQVLRTATRTKEQTPEGFATTLQKALGEVNQLQNESDRAAVQVASGQTDDIHQALIAAEKANLALQLTITIRNKVLEAYQEISRMQV